MLAFWIKFFKTRNIHEAKKNFFMQILWEMDIDKHWALNNSMKYLF